MVNADELPINVVTIIKLKVLTSLSQKARGKVQAASLSACRRQQTPPANRQNLTHSWYICGTWQLRTSPLQRKANRKISRWKCGEMIVEKAKAIL